MDQRTEATSQLTDVLARVGLVGDLEFRHVASYRSRYLVWRETHRMDVVRAQSQLVVRHDEVLGDRPQTVVDVHHRQTSVGSQEAFVVPGPQSVVEYLASVVCPSSSAVHAHVHIKTTEMNETLKTHLQLQVPK